MLAEVEAVSTALLKRQHRLQFLTRTHTEVYFAALVCMVMDRVVSHMHMMRMMGDSYVF